MEKILKNITAEKKAFYIFLAVQFIVWTGIGLIRTVLPTDALEGIYWGSLCDFGTPKHPPLAGWLSFLAYAPFKKDICIYIISQTFILLGFIYIYRLAKCFLEENQALLSVILLEGCWCYSYITGYYGFNPDVILMFTLPAITFYFYNCMKSDKKADWIKLGILVGFSFLNKYQTGMLIFSMAAWVLMFKREVFKNKFFYIAAAIAFLIFLPHILWLIKYDFYPIIYFEKELTAKNWLNHITGPLTFLLVQIGLITGTLLIFCLLKYKSKSPFKLIQDYDKKDFWFMILIGLGPLAIHLIMGLIEGGTMRPRWGFVFWYMIGIMLFYFFPCKIEKKDFMLGLKSAYVVMFIVFLSLGTLLTVEKNYRSRYPVSTVYNDLNKIWSEKYDTPLKYLGGYIEWTLPLTIYADSHPKSILDNYGYPDPWIKQDELKKFGVLILERNKQYIENYARKACPYLPQDYKIEPVEYKFLLYNALGMPREYSVHYVIVPPNFK